MSGDTPASPPGVNTPVVGDNTVNGSEGEGVIPSNVPDVGVPVVLAPPGWGDPPVLPGADPRPFPIGGVENVSKVFSHISIVKSGR